MKGFNLRSSMVSFEFSKALLFWKVGNALQEENMPKERSSSGSNEKLKMVIVVV